MATVLVVDDDRTVLKLVQRALGDMDLAVLTANTAAAGLSAVREHRPDVLLLDINLPDLSGLQLVEQVLAIDAKLPVVYITVSDASDVAIRAMTLGAYDYLLKPLDIEQVQDVVERALRTRRMMEVPVDLHEADPCATDRPERDVLIGRSPPMLNVYKEIGRVAGQDVTVLICGESGTGKELVARAIYQHSRRSGGPFLAVNCAALTDTLLESELFGHERGAFTGADRRRIGKFEQCHGGTIFLDEVGDMSPVLQSKVLRLLQEQKFERVGGTETIQTDVRIIAATNRNLEQMVEDGEFRLDLFHRLNDYRIDLPPLRERGDDIELLVDNFLVRLQATLGKPIQGISPEAMQLLKEYSWPGNVRELQTVLKKAVLRATGPVLVPEFLPAAVRRTQPGSWDAAEGGDAWTVTDLQRFVDQRLAADSCDLYAETLEAMERYLITRVLRETGGNQSKAAERLGITRGSLRNKIRALRISIGHVVQSAPAGAARGADA